MKTHKQLTEGQRYQIAALKKVGILKAVQNRYFSQSIESNKGCENPEH